MWYDEGKLENPTIMKGTILLKEDRYIVPITEVTSSFNEAKAEYGKYGHGFVFDDAEPTAVKDLAQGKRTVVVGEPGIGKTKLMEKLQVALEEGGNATKFVSLRSLDSIEQIDAFIATQAEKPKALLLDALDETPLSVFSAVLQKIQDVSEKYPDLMMYVSSRWVFMEKYSNSFSSYRFIAIKPFTGSQIKEYLLGGTRSEADVDALLQRVVQFHSRVIVQIPRYLFLLESFMEGKDINDVHEISRNDLFEHFIYSKLGIEAERNAKTQEMVPVIKRLLEKLALTMEIYQTNTITREELVTFFDDLKSDLKIVVLTQVSIDILLKNSVLQTSKDDTDKLEFENAEFQEYLAAKEITRLPEPRRAAFSFAADPVINEIYPSWYNTLSFLVDMEPEMLGQLLDFSGIRGEEFKVADEGFFAFLSRVNPLYTPDAVKKRLFTDVITYHNARLQWIPGQVTSALPGFFSAEQEVFLKKEIERAEPEEKTEAKYYVPLGNIVYVVAYLLRSKIEIDRPFWREKLVHYASEPCQNGVLPRHALLALTELHDSSVINELNDLTEASDELVRREFGSMCAELDPNKQESIDVFIKLIGMNDFHGRYGVFQITEAAGLKYFLRAYNDNERIRKEFLDDSSIFEDKDQKIIDHIRAVADDEMRELLKEAIVKSVNYSVAHTRGRSTFITGLMAFLREGHPEFIPEIIRRIHADERGEVDLYFAQELFHNLLSVEDIPLYIDAMLEVGSQPHTIMHTMTRIKLKGTEDSDAIYEAGREKLPDVYHEYEEARARPIENNDHLYDERILSEFRNALEPIPGQYMRRVFHDYISAADKLEELMSDEDRERFDTLIREEALRHDPSVRGLTINAETDDGASRNYTASAVAIIFGDALVAAKRRGTIDFTPYRSNIARFIPFAHNDELKTIFEVVPNFTPEEINPVVAIYNDRNTDLWRWQPDCLIEAAGKYNLTTAVPVLRDFVGETTFRIYDRVEALSVAESLRPDIEFLRGIFTSYSESENEDEKEIVVAANGLLVTKYSDSDAINWRLEQLKSRVGQSTPRPRSGVVRNVTDFDHELNYGKEFAKPLMELKQRGFEEQYLVLLDKALEVWALGEEYHAYAQYLWEIVYAYFDNLKEYGDYKVLRVLEEKIASVGSKQPGANWLAARMSQLRRSYLAAIGKPSRIAEAIRKYNAAREYDDKRIVTSADLFRHLHDAVDIDLRGWIEGEGAYELILTGKVYEAKKQEYEKLIQKTLKAQIENVMLKRGFQIEILREPDLLDDKRVDLLIRYGFVGPVVLEVKLTSNSDMRSRSVSSSKSYKSMDQYVRGYGASHGIFLIIVNSVITSLPSIKEEFAKIRGVSAISLDCYKFMPPKAPKKKGGGKKTTKKATKKKPAKTKRR